MNEATEWSHTVYSTAEKIQHTEAAIEHWKTVKPLTVIPNLAQFRVDTNDCGTLMCFGGHLTECKYFQDLGLEMNILTPRLELEQGILSGFDASVALFGVPYLFWPRTLGKESSEEPEMCQEHQFKGTDYELVAARLQTRLRILNEQSIAEC